MATDREKVIKEAKETLSCVLPDEKDTSGIMVRVGWIRDVIALLKEQEAVEPDTDSEGTCSCGNCGETVGYYPVGCNVPERLCKFCPECGKAVKWYGID